MKNSPELVLFKANTNTPKVGMTYIHRGKKCRIVKVRQAGTIDIEALDGSGAWRVTGLSFL